MEARDKADLASVNAATQSGFSDQSSADFWDAAEETRAWRGAKVEAMEGRKRW